MSDYIDILDTSNVRMYGAELSATIQRPISTGIPKWDAVCDETGGKGLGDWWYIVLGGASNAGKTRLAMHLLRVAASQGRSPGLISLETPRRGIQRSIYSQLTDFGYFDLLPHKFAPGWEGKTDRLASQINEWRMDSPDLEARMVVLQHARKPTLDEIMRDVRQLKHEGCDLIMVDHMQLVRSASNEIAQAATEVSEALREFAHESGVAIIGLSQLNRTASSQRDRCPTMHDLWGGTGMESNANQVMLVDHSRQSIPDARYPHILRTYLYLDKNREGPARVLIPVEVNFKTGVWREADPHEEDEWPE